MQFIHKQFPVQLSGQAHSQNKSLSDRSWVSPVTLFGCPSIICLYEQSYYRKYLLEKIVHISVFPFSLRYSALPQETVSLLSQL